MCSSAFYAVREFMRIMTKNGHCEHKEKKKERKKVENYEKLSVICRQQQEQLFVLLCVYDLILKTKSYVTQKQQCDSVENEQFYSENIS